MPAAMLRYLVACKSKFPSGPLFILENIKTGPKSTQSTAGFDSNHFSGHSFRIGAASTAAAKGVAESTIQTLGCWKASVFLERNLQPSHPLLPPLFFFCQSLYHAYRNMYINKLNYHSVNKGWNIVNSYSGAIGKLVRGYERK